MSAVTEGLGQPATAFTSQQALRQQVSSAALASSHLTRQTQNTIRMEDSLQPSSNSFFPGHPSARPMPHADTAPPQGPGAFDYYSAQSDHIQEMMRAREARRQPYVPHIIIKGHSQPVPTMAAHGHAIYPVGGSDGGRPAHHQQQHGSHASFESPLEHDDEFLNSFNLPPLQVTGAMEADPPHMTSSNVGFANMPLHLVDRDFESLPAELPSHVMDRLFPRGESPAGLPHSHLSQHHAPAASPSPGATPLGRPTLARTFSAPNVADVDWDASTAYREEAPAQQQQQQQHQQQSQQDQQQYLPRGDHRQPSTLSNASLSQHERPAHNEANGAADRSQPAQTETPNQLLMGCSAELREFAAHADIEQLHKVYLTPANKRKGKGGRQPANDPRLDPNMDPKKARRILANRLSAARSKMKQRTQVDEIQKHIDTLESQKEALQKEVASLQAACNDHVQMKSQLSHRIMVVQQHCNAQQREHAQLMDAHKQLGLAPPNTTHHADPDSTLTPNLNPNAAPHRVPSPSQTAFTLPVPQPLSTIPTSSLARAASPASLPMTVTALNATGSAALPKDDTLGGAGDQGGGTGNDIQTRNRLMQELQRFELPPELRQLLQNIPPTAASAGR